MCIRDSIKTATRQKHKPLNSYVSLNKPIYDEESDRTLIDVIIGNKVLNPEEIIIDREDLALSLIHISMGAQHLGAADNRPQVLGIRDPIEGDKKGRLSLFLSLLENILQFRIDDRGNLGDSPGGLDSQRA